MVGCKDASDLKIGVDELKNGTGCGVENIPGNGKDSTF